MYEINGIVDNQRVPSKELEEQIQAAVKRGERQLRIIADGQHGIGGRLWPTPEEKKLVIDGTSGQRVGSMGMMGTKITINGSCSDDVGWLNCGAEITVLGDVSNGAHNAGAQGKLYVQGGGGARCDTMTRIQSGWNCGCLRYQPAPSRFCPRLSAGCRHGRRYHLFSWYS